MLFCCLFIFESNLLYSMQESYQNTINKCDLLLQHLYKKRLMEYESPSNLDRFNLYFVLLTEFFSTHHNDPQLRGITRRKLDNFFNKSDVFRNALLSEVNSIEDIDELFIATTQELKSLKYTLAHSSNPLSIEILNFKKRYAEAVLHQLQFLPEELEQKKTEYEIENVIHEFHIIEEEPSTHVEKPSILQKIFAFINFQKAS